MNSIFQKEKQKLRLKLVGNKQLSCIRAELNWLLLFSEKEEEAVSIMMALFDKEYVLNTYLKDMAKENREEGREEGSANTLLANIKSIMQNLGISLEKALEVLNIPTSDYAKYEELLKQSV